MPFHLIARTQNSNQQNEPKFGSLPKLCRGGGRSSAGLQVLVFFRTFPGCGLMGMQATGQKSTLGTN